MSGRDRPPSTGSWRGLSRAEVAATAQAIVSQQLPTGMIPWFHDGHSDPWNHVEALMALVVAGRVEEADAGYEWLARTQHANGAWYHYYLSDGIESARLDANVCAYVAAGAWHRHVALDDLDTLRRMWPMVEAAIEFVLGLQQPSGEITWCIEPDGTRGEFALLTSSSSIYFSLRCALAMAEALGEERPHWELSAARLGNAVSHRPELFEPKDRWAMDWYYPVLCGALTGSQARERMKHGWETFVMDGLGVRCVSDRPWTTAAETAECALALDHCGMTDEAREMFSWIGYLRNDDGSYFTGMVHPDRVTFPGNERSTYTAAVVILADDAFYGSSPTSGFFAGDGLPEIVEIDLDGDLGAKR
ncbi:MAG: prenyltransferase [Acidimicrobiales bacterium]